MIQRMMMIAMAAIAFIGLAATDSPAAHPTVPLKAYDGSPAGGTVAYSPKNTCAGCHIKDCITSDQKAMPAENMNNWCETEAQRSALNSTADYAGAFTKVSKTHFKSDAAGTPSAEVTYTLDAPRSGVSASYHVQQGQNVPWNKVAYDYYKVPSFTSSPGMYGKY